MPKDIAGTSKSESYLVHSNSRCQICGDRATGRHYGAISCDGCKGFFRRSIRKRQNYQCRHKKNCNVEKDKRNQCRYCRLQKCIIIGMKQEAVQSERDRISSKPLPRPPTPISIPPLPPPKEEQRSMLSVILAAELVFQHVPPASPIEINVEAQEAGVDDLLSSMKEQVLLLVQWAKRIPPFMQLAVDDQICLLKAHASEHLLLGVTRRSRNQAYLLLGNNYIVSRQSPENSFALIAGRVLDQLIVAFRNVDVDETEYACLKAIVFFDPYADGLQARQAVFQLRQEIILALYSYIRTKCLGSRVTCQMETDAQGSNPQSRASSPRLSSSMGLGDESSASDLVQEFSMVKRFGELLLLVPSVRSIAEDMVDHIKFYKLFGAAKVDNVLHELLLGDTAADESVQPVQPEVPSAENSQMPQFSSTDADATPGIVDIAPVTSTAEVYGHAVMPRPNFSNSSLAPSPTETNFEGQVLAPAVSIAQFSALEPCFAPQIQLMSPQPSGSRNHLTQSPGLSTLAAAAFVASQTMSTPSNLALSGGFLSPPSDPFPSGSERVAESPTILSFAFSNRPPVPNPNRRLLPDVSPLRSTGIGGPVTMKPEQR